VTDHISPRVSRRALLTLGGLTLLTGCSSPALARTAGPLASGAAPTGSASASGAPLTPGTPGAPGSFPASGSPSASATTSAVRGNGTGPVVPSASGVPGTPGAPGASGTPGVPGQGAVLAGDGKPEFYVHKGPHAIALTIDDGPDPRWTPQVLALLERYRITATFCQVGQQVTRLQGLVREVAAQGHLLANHTWTHADLARSTAPRIHDEIARTGEALEQAAGSRPTFFRAPYGAWSQQVLAECRAQQLTPLDWSVDPRDWSRPGVDHITSTILRTTRPGSIILEHDGGGDRSQTVAALRIVLPRLLDEGYTFVTP
jgi:peptidoglycan/xylan/chitin deacetylase (PgdA/CDA1 family)